MNKQNVKHASAMMLVIVFSVLPLLSIAQTVEYDHRLFSFKIHDNLKYEVLEGFPVYTSGTIFLSFKEIDTYDNAAKYADALENKFLDQDDVYTDRGVDTLDGWPMIYLEKEDKSKDDVFVQQFYLFDDGKKIYNLSVSGYEMDMDVIKNYFSVTKSSFKFKTQTRVKGGLSFALPSFMSKDDAVGFWSHLYNKDETIDIPIRAHHDAEVKYEDDVKSTVKSLKSMKPTAFTEEKFTVGAMQATKIALTYIKKLKTTSEDESKQVYIIQHPQGGTVSIHFSGQPKVISILGARMDAVVKAASF